MVKLSPELIQQAAQYINPVRDRELNLRGYKIPVIENLGASLDQFDTIDLSDNDVRKLDGFPLLKRLKCILVNNNRIVRIGDDLGTSLPNLECLILSKNNLAELSDIDALASLPNLSTLSLMHCPLVVKPHYRLYVIFKLPTLRLLDFQKVKMKERDEAMQLFKSKEGRQLQREIATKGKTFVPGGNLQKEIKSRTKPTQGGPSKPELANIRQAINQAQSLEEVERLNKMLQSGQFSLRQQKPEKSLNGSSYANNDEEQEEDEEEGMPNQDVEMEN